MNTRKDLGFRKKGSVGKGALIGLVSGAIAGMIIGYAAGDDQCEGFCIMSMSAEAKAGTAGIGLGILGVSVGAITGASGKYYRLNGSQGNYYGCQDDLIKRSIVKE